jgi:uncharacterized membrane protein
MEDSKAPPLTAEQVQAKVPTSRIESVDALRGAVMIVMAVDHVREFIGQPVAFHGVDVSQLDAALFLTRWITHYCAPVFVFLAGTAAYFQTTRGRAKSEVAKFLWRRGLWLAFLEVTVIRFFWTLNFNYHLTPLGVLWAIGWSMVVLSGLIFLPVRAVASLALLMIVGHHALDRFDGQQFGDFSWLFAILHVPRAISLDAEHELVVYYPLIPWIGVMAAGFVFGELFNRPTEQRRQIFWRLGLGLSAAFFIVRGLNVYGDPSPWSSQYSTVHVVLSFLNCTKYPPSLSYLLMTLGPALLFLAWCEGRTVPARALLLAIGRAPLFYYVLHFAFILALSGALLLGCYGWEALISSIKSAVAPAKFSFGLPVVYAMAIAVVAALYPLCRWFVALRSRRKDWSWLSYL